MSENEIVWLPAVESVGNFDRVTVAGDSFLRQPGAPHSAWRKRLQVAWAALRGAPVIFGLHVRGTEVAFGKPVGTPTALVYDVTVHVAGGSS